MHTPTPTTHSLHIDNYAHTHTRTHARTHTYIWGKKSLVMESGKSKLLIRTSIYFHPMSDGQVKKYSARLYFRECPQLFGKRTSKNLGVLVHRTSDHFNKILPLYI